MFLSERATLIPLFGFSSSGTRSCESGVVSGAKLDAWCCPNTTIGEFEALIGAAAERPELVVLA